MKGRTALVLSIFAAAKRLRHPPIGRIFLVKLAYLAEVIRPEYELWTHAFDFIRHNHGPYSEDVLRRVDFLCFHGLAQCDDFSISRSQTRATYSITEEGQRIAKLLAATPTGATLAKLADDLIWSMQCLGISTAVAVCDLVYQEPSFEALVEQEQRSETGQQVTLPVPSPDNPAHPSFELRDILHVLNERHGNEHPSPRTLLLEFLNLLAAKFYRMTLAAQEAR